MDDAYNYLINTYGPVMTAPQVAKVLHRSLRAIWVAASNKNDPLNEAKRRVGKRVYFSTSKIASLLDKPSNSRNSHETI